MATKEQEENKNLLKELEFYSRLIKKHKEETNRWNDGAVCKMGQVKNKHSFGHKDYVGNTGITSVAHKHTVMKTDSQASSEEGLSRSRITKALFENAQPVCQSRVVVAKTAGRREPDKQQVLLTAAYAKRSAVNIAQQPGKARCSKYSWSRQVPNPKPVHAAVSNVHNLMGGKRISVSAGSDRLGTLRVEAPNLAAKPQVKVLPTPAAPVIDRATDPRLQQDAVKVSPSKYKLSRLNTRKLEDSFTEGFRELTRSCTSTPISELKKISKFTLARYKTVPSIAVSNSGSSSAVKKSRFKLVRKQDKNTQQQQTCKNKAGTPKIVVSRHKIIKRSPGAVGKYPGLSLNSQNKTMSSSWKRPVMTKSRYRLVKPALGGSSGKHSAAEELKTARNARIVLKTKHKIIKRTSAGSGSESKLKSVAVAPKQSLLLKSKYKLVKHAIHTARAKTRRYSCESKPSPLEPRGAGTRRVLRPKRTKYSIVKGFTGRQNSDPGFLKRAANMSRNRYKFVAPNTVRKKQLVCHQRSKLKLDRRFWPMKRRRGQYVTLKGQLYLKRGNALTRIGLMKVFKGFNTLNSKSRDGNISPYKFDRRRTVVSRVRSGAKPSHGCVGASSQKSSAQILARHVLAKSLATVVQHRFRTDNRPSRATAQTSKFCLYYNRFGKCSRGTQCPFIHDADKIAICSRFLRGTCNIKSCLFSHKLSKEKMPVCSYFLKGRCSRDECPYLHVNVGHGAQVCQDFVHGYCAAGEKCKKKHTMNCPAFEKEGTCPDGVRCKLRHVKKSMKRTYSKVNISVQSAAEDEPKSKRRKEEGESVRVDDRHLPLSQRVLPSFIAISGTGAETPAQPSDSQGRKPSIQIRPVFSNDDETT